MDDAVKQARESRERAEDFFAANPDAQYVAVGGVISARENQTPCSRLRIPGLPAVFRSGRRNTP